MRRGCVFLVALAVTLTASPPRARSSPDESEVKVGKSILDPPSKVRWSGSQVTLRTMANATTFDRSADLTYNPFVAMQWSFKPWFWITEKLYARAVFDIVTELTEPDTTTNEGEALVQDLQVVVGGSKLYRIPRVDIDVSADLAFVFPTSKAARARTLALAVGPRARLSRTFELLDGLVVGYNLRVLPFFHRYTTGELETPLIPGCGSELGGCDPYISNGVRNPAVRLSQIVDVAISVNDWLSAGLAVGHVVDWLHSIGDVPDEATLSAADDQDERHLTLFELSVSVRPIDLLEIGVGLTALHPQLAPDSSYYVPFFNRYSIFFVDLTLDVEDAVARIQRMVK